MAVLIRMPDFGTAVDEIRITKWLVSEGAGVKRGDLLAEIETDKATFELESIAEGILLKQMVPAGTTTEAGQPVAWIGAAGEQTDSPPAPTAKPRTSPVVANLATKLGVDLAGVKGSGADGVITRDDVLRSRGRTAASVTVPSARVEEPGWRGQAAVARAVQWSNAEIPHLRVSISIDMTEVERARGLRRAAYYDAVFLKAIACAAANVPGVTVRGVEAPDCIDVALAVDTSLGLFLPVIRDVRTKDVSAIQADVEAVVGRLRAGGIRPDEMDGASVALSNLGMYPVDWFEAIIFPGHTAILALGRVGDRPVAMDGKLEIRKMATVVLAADHRVTNGRSAAEFLTALKQAVELGEVIGR